MQFTKLRLTGFKSFVEGTDLLIEPGLTGVVGPNGCGKSNLMEALRWVMGESSYKSMRASGMEDVIFAGTTGRPPRNTAEVMLTIDNKSRKAPAAFNDDDTLEVIRRIERDYGSDYRINGKEVRARDVQLLFADASSGARSPALVGQGRIAELIAAKPQARRKILEEAAGISGLNARRHETETRLKAAETNLSRVEDVIKELASQLEHLAKQAKQATRYKTLSTDIRELERKLYARRWSEIGQLVKDANEALKTAEADVLARAQTQASAARRQTDAAANLPPLREREAEAAAALQRLVSARDQLAGEKQRASERMQNIERQIAQIEADLQREQSLIDDAADAHAKLAAEATALREEEQQISERSTLATSKLNEAEQKVQTGEELLGSATQALAEANARRLSIQKRQMEAQGRFDRFSNELTSLQKEKAELEHKRQGMADIGALTLEVETSARALLEAESAATTFEAAMKQARSAEEQARAPLKDAENDVQKLEVEIRTLQKVVLGSIDGNWRPVLDAIEVDKGYEIALGAALSDLLELPVDAAAPRYIAQLAFNFDDPQLPEGARALSRFVKAPHELDRILNQIGVIEADKAESLRSQLKTGQRLVTIEGEMWGWDGVIIKAGAPSAAARRLAEKNRLQDLEDNLAQAKTNLEQERARYQALHDESVSAASVEQQSRQSLRALQAAVTQAQNKMADAERATASLTNRLSVIEATSGKLSHDREEMSVELQNAASEIGDDAARSELEVNVAKLRARVNQERSDVAEARALSQTVQNEARARTARLTAIDSDIEAWTARQTKADGQRGVLRERHVELETERATLSQMPAEIEAKELALADTLGDATLARRDAGDALAVAETTLREIDREEKTATASLGEAREQRAAAQARIEGVNERREALTITIAETLDISLEELLEGFDEATINALQHSNDLEERLDRYKRERERLGAVNLRAEEEVSELSTRHDTLVAERDDLVAAIERLRTGIHTLNKEGRERLLAAFTVVNGHFQTLFTTLFGGGTAELTLTESDDPLDAGLEIIAHPPGKKPQSLSLLSGGEQALTAMALIFAVFLTNPAPICVLDEVDAPLDDHNVERYCDLMDKMVESTNTRFIIITHNPVTMSRMHRLFGVTMAERGISQLVSVDLQSAERMVEAA